MAKSVKAKDLNRVISLVEEDLKRVLEETRNDLLKAHPGEETPAEESPDDSVTSPEGSAPAAPPSPAEATSAPVSPEAPIGPPGEPGAEGMGEQPPSHEEMVQMLAQLPPEQLDMWMAAAQEVKAGQDGGMGAGAGGPPPEASPPPAAGPSPEAMKSEALGNALSKAETNIAEQDVKIEALTKSLKEISGQLLLAKTKEQELGKALEGILRRPDRKALTQAPAPVEKREEDVSSLSKAEINARLSKAVRSGKFTKKDNETMNGFLFGGQPVDTIRHLITAPSA